MKLGARIIGVVFGLLLLGAGSLPVWAYEIPQNPTQPVYDFAGVLSPSQEATLSEKLTALYQTGKGVMVILTIPSLDGQSIEELSHSIATKWGIGDKKESNGFLILVAPSDKQIRYEVGYGLEPYVTDIQTSIVHRDIVVPAFRANDYFGGLNGAVDAFIAAIDKGVPISEKSSSKAPLDRNTIPGFLWWIIGILFSPVGLFVVVWLSVVLGRSRSWWLGGVIGLIVGFVFGVFFSITMAIIGAVVYMMIGLILDLFVSKAHQRSVATGNPLPWWASGFISGRSSGGRWGGGGGFGGGFGGGSFGGGGSTGRW